MGFEPGGVSSAMRTNKNRRNAAPDLNPVPSSLALPSRDCGAVSERMALVRSPRP